MRYLVLLLLLFFQFVISQNNILFNIPLSTSQQDYQEIIDQATSDAENDFGVTLNVTLYKGDVPETSKKILSGEFQIFLDLQDTGSSLSLSYFTTAEKILHFSLDRSPVFLQPDYPYYVQMKPSIEQELEGYVALFNNQGKNFHVSVISAYEDSEVQKRLKDLGLQITLFINFKENDDIPTAIDAIKEVRSSNILLLSHDTQESAEFLVEAWNQEIYGRQYFWVGSDGCLNISEIVSTEDVSLLGQLALIPTSGYGDKYTILLNELGVDQLPQDGSYLYDSIYYSGALLQFVENGCSSECPCPTDTKGGSLVDLLPCVTVSGASGKIQFASRSERYGVFDIGNWNSENVMSNVGIYDDSISLTGTISTTGIKTPITIALLFFQNPNTSIFLTELCKKYIVAIDIALDKINSDPTLLPDHTLLTEPFWYDSEQTGLLNAFEISSLGLYPAALGAITSAVTVTTQLVFNAFQIPQFSGSATSSDLSDDTVYGYFGRNVPSDAFQSTAIARMIHHFGWDQVATLNSNDDYGTAGFVAFADEAEKIGLTLEGLQTFQAGSSTADQFRTQMDRLKRTSVRVFFLFAIETECIGAFEAAREAGLLGPGYTWFVSDGCRAIPAELSPDLGGAFSALPWAGEGSQERDEIIAEVNKVTDPSVPFIYGEFYYDLIWVFANVFDTMIKKGQDYLDGPSVKKTLTEISVTRITGVNTFEKNLDRGRDSVNYTLSYYDTSTQNWEIFGSWTEKTDVVVTKNPTFSDGSTTTPPPDFVYNIEQNEWDEPVSIAISVLTAVGIILTVAIMNVILVSKETPVVKAASPFFLNVILFGILCGYCSIYVFLGKPTTATCILQPWLAGLSFVIIYSAILTKTYRIYKIFDNTQLVKLKMSNSVIGQYATFFLAIEIIINILWTAIDPLEPREESLNLTSDDTKVLICSSDHYWAFLGVYLAYKGGMLLMGVILCWWVRQVLTLYNESKQIAFATYNIFLFSVLLLPIYFTMRGIPDAALAILGAGFLLCNTGTLLILFMPKLYVIFLQGGGSQMARTTGKTQSYRDSAIKSSALDES